MCIVVFPSRNDSDLLKIRVTTRLVVVDEEGPRKDRCVSGGKTLEMDRMEFRGSRSRRGRVRGGCDRKLGGLVGSQTGSPADFEEEREG